MPYFPTTPHLPLTPISELLVRGRFVEKAPDIQPVLSRDRFDVLVLKLESLESPSSAMRRDDASARLWKYSISPCRSQRVFTSRSRALTLVATQVNPSLGL